MSLSRVFRGYFNRAKAQDKGRRRVLLIELGPEDAERLDEALGSNPHRSQNIPVTFVVGEAAEGLEGIRKHFAEIDGLGRPRIPATGSGVKPAPATPLIDQPTVLEEVRDRLIDVVGELQRIRSADEKIVGGLGEVAEALRAEALHEARG
jgi:hypothetical protein